MKLWQGSLTGMGLGLLAAPIVGALIGGFYGIGFCEAHVYGVWAIILGAVVYGILFFIPTALVGAFVGGFIAASRGTGRQGMVRQDPPLDWPPD
jgi:hypothetical protein